MTKKIIDFLKINFKKFILFSKLESTVVVTSNQNKKTWSKTIKYQTIVIIMIGIFILSISAIQYLITSKEREQTLADLKSTHQIQIEKRTRIEEQIKKINTYQSSYHKEINEIFNNFGNLDEATLWKMELLSNRTDSTDWLNFPKLEEVVIDPKISQLNQNRINLMITLNHLEDIGKYVDLRSSLQEHIPIGWPIDKNRGYKTSGYGPRISPFRKNKEFHTGIDIAAPLGSYILAMASGKVFFSGDKRSYGKVIMIRHRYGYRTIYSHNAQNLVETGDIVKKYQRIGKVGMTGRATGPHIHYEIRIGRQHVDPWDYLISKF